MSAERAKHRLVEWLEDIAEREDRAALAALRGSLRDGHAYDALPLVLPCLGAQAAEWQEDDALLLAGLFGLHPAPGRDTLPQALRRIWRGPPISEGVETRFQALLNAKRADLATHLRHAVSLLAARGVGIDWDELYEAIRFWDHPADRVRRRWARGFWGEGRDGDESEPAQSANHAKAETQP